MEKRHAALALLLQALRDLAQQRLVELTGEPPSFFRAPAGLRNPFLDPVLHREAYLHVLHISGLSDEHAEMLYQRVIDPAHWTPYPDTAAVLRNLRDRGVRTAVVSNIAKT